MLTLKQVVFILFFCFAYSDWNGELSQQNCLYRRYSRQYCTNPNIVALTGRQQTRTNQPFEPPQFWNQCEALCDDPDCAAAFVTMHAHQRYWELRCHIVSKSDGPCIRQFGRNFVYTSMRDDLDCTWTHAPTTSKPSRSPTPTQPSKAPTPTQPTIAPIFSSPSLSPTLSAPSLFPTTEEPSKAPTPTAPTMSPLAVGGHWQHIGDKSCEITNDWINIGNANTLQEAKQLMVTHDQCRQPGSLMFYSGYSYAWGVRCATPDKVANCHGTNSNWQGYLLTGSSDCRWEPIHSSQCPESYFIGLMGECTLDMDPEQLCQANHGPLPDGNEQFDVNNCGQYDVFTVVCGDDNADEDDGEPGCNPDWVAITDPSECPSGNLHVMPECTPNMVLGDLCEADRRLPNGEWNFNIDNCGPYDVFRYQCTGEDDGEPECNPDWVALTDPCPSGDLSTMPECTTNMALGDLCEADRSLPNGEENFNIDNCGPYDVFRYQCTGGSRSPGTMISGGTYIMVGHGWCRTFDGDSVRGMRGFATREQCKEICDTEQMCIGYVKGIQDTCVIHGLFDRSDFPSIGRGWSTTFMGTGNNISATQVNADPGLTCFKRIG